MEVRESLWIKYLQQSRLDARRSQAGDRLIYHCYTGKIVRYKYEKYEALRPGSMKASFVAFLFFG